MIIKFKIFENDNREPEIGDYIVIKLSDLYGVSASSKVTNFLNSHIGKIINKNYPFNYYAVKFDEEFENEDTMFFNYGKGLDNNIEFFSKNKQDAESYLASKKYNL